MRTKAINSIWKFYQSVFYTTFSLSLISFPINGQKPNISLKSLSITPGTPTIQFSPEWKMFRVNVANNVETVVITAVTQLPETTIKINGKTEKSGVPSQPVHVNIGRNIIPIEVISPDKKEKSIYRIKVMRQYPTPTWVKVTDHTQWKPRDSAGELVFNNKMWIIGGYTPELANDVWSSEDGINWVKEGEIPNTIGVDSPVCFVFKNKIWIATFDGKFYSSDNGKQWTLVTDNIPWGGRYAAGGVIYNNKMWVMGGKKGREIYNDVWSSEDGKKWVLVTSEAPWSKRQLFSMVAAYDGKMWVLGGGITIYHPFRSYRDVWFSEDGKNWTQVTDKAPWLGRIWNTSAVYKNKLWVFNGFRAEPTWNNFNDVWYTTDGKDWNEFISDNIWSPRHEVSAYVFKDKLWVVAGMEWPLQNDVWYLEIKGLTFTTQPECEEFANTPYYYQAHADFNESGGKVKYELLKGPNWLSINKDTGLLSGIPDKVEEVIVSIKAYDDYGETAQQTYKLYVLPLLSPSMDKED